MRIILTFPVFLFQYYLLNNPKFLQDQPKKSSSFHKDWRNLQFSKTNLVDKFKLILSRWKKESGKIFCCRYFTFDLDTFLEDVFTTFLWPAPEKKSENESSISICWMDLLTRQIFSFGTRMNISIMATGLAVVICFHGKNSRGKIFRYNRHFKYYY